MSQKYSFFLKYFSQISVKIIHDSVNIIPDSVNMSKIRKFLVDFSKILFR